MIKNDAPTLKLKLPERTSKPRLKGTTMVIDSGLPLGAFADYVESYGDLIDWVKFGWGSSQVNASVTQAKIRILQEHHVGFYFGGTLFERAFIEGQFDAYVSYCQDMGAAWAEVSDGTIPLSAEDKVGAIRKMRAAGLRVLSEVGYKLPGRAQELTPSAWAHAIQRDLAAGAELVITESRESGRVGLADSHGALRQDIIEAINAAGIKPEELLFEAPTKQLQTQLITDFGPNVNLGNIAPADIVGVETLRTGLRSDTLLTMVNRVRV